MLRKFALRNYRSFRGEGTMDLFDKGSGRGGWRFAPSLQGGDVAVAAAVFGPHAVGKTSFLKGLEFLCRFALSSWQDLLYGGKTGVEPFLFGEGETGPTEFLLETESDAGDVYSYRLLLSGDMGKIRGEALSVRKRDASRWSKMFERSWDEVKLHPSSGIKDGDVPRSIIRPNASFASTVRQTNARTFGGFLGTLETLTYNPGFDCGKALHGNSGIRRRTEEFLKELHLGITGLTVDKVYGLSGPFFVRAVHSVDGKEYSLPLEDESEGVRKLVAILPQIFTATDGGRTFICDGLEDGLRPYVVSRLLELFYSKRSQVVFSSRLEAVRSELFDSQVFRVSLDERHSSVMEPAS